MNTLFTILKMSRVLMMMMMMMMIYGELVKN